MTAVAHWPTASFPLRMGAFGDFPLRGASLSRQSLQQKVLQNVHTPEPDSLSKGVSESQNLLLGNKPNQKWPSARVADAFAYRINYVRTTLFLITIRP